MGYATFDRLTVGDEIFKILTGDDTGANSNTAQPWLPTAGGVAVEAGTLYWFEGHLHLSRSAGNTSHTTSILFGGTATLTFITGIAECKEGHNGLHARVGECD